MTEYGESKSCFRDEDVAGCRDEWKAGRIGPALVVARDDHPFACIFEQYLRRTQYVTGWQIGRIHSARQPKRLAIGDRHSAVLLAVTQRHDGDSLGRSHGTRSEEHTSELQSLLRTSYAVFCLKKQTQTTKSMIYKNKKKS